MRAKTDWTTWAAMINEGRREGCMNEWKKNE